MKIKIIFILIICSIVAIVQADSLFAATYYLSPSGNDGSGDGSYNNAWRTFSHANSVMSGGDTLIYKNGIYDYSGSNIVDPVSGSDGAPTYILAETDGGVIIDGGGSRIPINITGSHSYITVQGIYGRESNDGVIVISGADDANRVNNIIIQRCSGRNAGGATDALLEVGNYAEYCLVEDCWFWGVCRSGVSLYGKYPDGPHTANITIRRVVVRFDGVQDDSQGENGFTFYGAENSIFENCIAIDFADSGSAGAAFRHRSGSSNNKIYGCIAINTGNFRPFNLDSDMTYGLLDCVGVGTSESVFVNCRVNPSFSIDRCTFIGSSGDVIDTTSSSGINVTNCLFKNCSRADKADSYCYFDNSGATYGTNALTGDSGILYPLRIEDSSACDGTGQGDVDRGANVIKRYVDGVLTADDLWSWPYQDRMYNEMRESYAYYGDSPATTDHERGFCADSETFTDYIWNYLGNENPYDGDTYYVAESGDNGDDGSLGNPWETIQHAADTVVGGDTVIVQTGTYDGFVISTAGTATDRITFRAANSNVILNSNVAYEARSAVIHVTGNYVTIDGFRMIGESGSSDRGVRISKDSGDDILGIEIKNCRISNMGSVGISTSFAVDALIENNEVWGSGNTHGIYVANSGDNPIVRGNTSYDNYRGGIQINADPAEEGDGIITNAIVDSNIVYNNGTSGLNFASIRNSVIINNLVYGNQQHGIASWDDGVGDAYGSKDNKYFNNTVIVPSGGAHAFSLRNGSTGNEVKNNILIHEGGQDSLAVDPESMSGLDSDYNIVTNIEDPTGSLVSLTSWQNNYNQDDNSVVATSSEVFENPGADNYQLKAGGPAVNQGANLSAYVDDDLLEVSRPQNGIYDIGAYEKVAAGGDSTAPAAVSNLSAVTGSADGEIDLTWTAPGDDGTSGTASVYIIKYSTSDITNDTLFNAASDVSGEPTPSVAGTSESMTVSSLTPGTTYYFAMKTQDEVPNTSGLSNSANAEAKETIILPDTIPPYTTGHDPIKNAIAIARDTDIVVHVKDDGDGVDINTIVMKVNGTTVTPTITGTPADYTLTYAPGSQFANGEVVSVSVEASDLAP
ncbi:MAG: hypothetical protein GY853_08535 [PVC group bacterium]|nr:hypothetical protein [PVC group bacterium]